MRKSLLLVVLAFLLGSAVPGQAGELRVDLEQPLKQMSPLLYGLFFEDINLAADGGLYACLLRNRSFEHRSFPDAKPFDAYTGWVFNDRMMAKGSVSLGTDLPLNENNLRYMRVKVASGAYRVVNEGYARRPGQAGITLKKSLDYHGFIHLRNMGFDGQISVRLQSRGGQDMSETVLLEAKNNWTKQEFSLTAREGGLAILVFTFEGTGELDLDMAALFPGDAYGADWQNGGLRADLVEALKELQPRFIRFPGGCVAEGSYHLSNIYRWKDTIGPIEERRENENTWGGMQSYGLGFHEYFQLCEDLGAQPVPVVSAAMLCQVRGSKGLPLMGQGLQDYIQDVLDLVAYAREPADGPWGSKRAANGHKEPFELNFLAIGNENWGSEYFYRYGLIARAVKERYSDITCIVAAGPVAEGDLIRDSWAAIRRQYPQDVVDEHYYMPSEWFLRNTTRYDNYPRTGNPVFLGEYAAHEPAQGGKRPNNLKAALAEAAYLVGIERNSDLVRMACYAPLLAREGFDHWTPNLVWFNEDSVLKTPSFYVQQMFSSTLGEQVLFSATDAEGLYQVVTRDQDTLYLKLVNPNETPLDINLRVDGLTEAEGTLCRLSGQLAQTNTFANPQQIVPQTEAFSLREGGAPLRLPAYSLTILKLPIK